MAEPIPLPEPEIVTLRALSITLLKVSGLVVCMGVVFAIDALCRGFFGTLAGNVGWIPWLGDVVEAPIHKIEQKVSSFLAGLERHIDPAMGFYMHALAINVGYLADGSAEAGWVSWAIARAVGVTRRAVHALPSRGTITHATTTVVRQTRVIVQRVEHVSTRVAYAAPGFVTHQVGALAGELEHVITWDIPSLRLRTKKVEGEVDRAWKWIRAHPLAIPEAAATALVAAALARLGGSWIHCSTWKRAGKFLCGMDGSLLDALLLGSLAIFGTVSLVDMANEMVDLEGEIVNTMTGFFRELADVPRRTAEEQGF